MSAEGRLRGLGSAESDSGGKEEELHEFHERSNQATSAHKANNSARFDFGEGSMVELFELVACTGSEMTTAGVAVTRPNRTGSAYLPVSTTNSSC